MATRLVIRIDFDTGRRLGPGKIALLEAIGRTGSIAAAGREFRMGYRRAWLLADELNPNYVIPSVFNRDVAPAVAAAVAQAAVRDGVARRAELDPGKAEAALR